MTGVAASANPFRVQRVHAIRYRPEGTSWSAIDASFEALECRAAVIGAHGAGKTTFLETFAERWADRLAPQALFTNRADRGRVPVDWRLDDTARFTPDTLLLIDGFDLLGRFARRRVVRVAGRCGGMLVTAHEPRRDVPTLHTCRPRVSTLDWICAHLAPETVPPATAAQLFHAHRGNVRDALRELYDRHM